MSDNSKVYVRCALERGTFPSEILYRVESIDGEVEGVSPLHYVRNSDGSPVTEPIPNTAFQGQVAGWHLRETQGGVLVLLPFERVVTLPKSALVPQPDTASHDALSHGFAHEFEPLESYPRLMRCRRCHVAVNDYAIYNAPAVCSPDDMASFWKGEAATFEALYHKERVRAEKAEAEHRRERERADRVVEQLSNCAQRLIDVQKAHNDLAERLSFVFEQLAIAEVKENEAPASAASHRWEAAAVALLAPRFSLLPSQVNAFRKELWDAKPEKLALAAACPECGTQAGEQCPNRPESHGHRKALGQAMLGRA